MSVAVETNIVKPTDASASAIDAVSLTPPRSRITGDNLSE
jgi:hypothetical protein